MKRFVFGFLFGIWCTVAIAVPARVDYIVDGDTFAGVVTLDGGVDVSVRVRIRNVDTPELHSDCAAERELATRARNRLAQVIPVGSVVNLTNIKDDKYLGRIDANVADSHGADVGARLVREGVGRKYSGGRRTPWCK